MSAILTLALLTIALACIFSGLWLTGVSKSQYLEKKVLNEVLRNTDYTPPATVYLALFTVAPTNTTGGTEVTTSGTAYARQSIAFAAPSGDPSVCLNSADVTFPVATANYGTVVAVAIMDASTAGNVLYYGALSANQTVNTGGQYVQAASSLSVSED